MWFKESVFYQIYPLNMTGAPTKYNDGQVEHRILQLKNYTDYLQDLGIKGVYFNPIFSSDTHGYDTRDYQKIDERLGDNQDFKEVVDDFHKHGIKVVLDAVFNHVGRGFFAFQDVLQYREDSQYRYWFHIDFNGNSNYDDHLWYEGWEGHYELVKLNLDNPEVQQYLKDSVTYWINEFGIDGIRFDVAYCLPRWFIAMIVDHAKSLKPDIFTLGEILGDNAGYMFHECHLDSITDYPSYKGFWSSFNSKNIFEIAHTLKRNMFDMYQGQSLWTFLDNHDVVRIASQLENKDLLPILFGLQLSLPGIPCIYYGSEWGIEGQPIKGVTDDPLRPEIHKPEPNELTLMIKKMIELRNTYQALSIGSFKEIRLTNTQYIYEREYHNQKIIIALNIDNQPFDINYHIDEAVELLTDKTVSHIDNLHLEPLSISYYLVK